MWRVCATVIPNGVREVSNTQFRRFSLESFHNVARMCHRHSERSPRSEQHTVQTFSLKSFHNVARMCHRHSERSPRSEESLFACVSTSSCISSTVLFPLRGAAHVCY